MESSSSSHHSSSTNAPRSVWLRTTMTSASVVALEEQLEKDNMQREKEWLLSNEVPFVCKEIKTLIERTLELISAPNFQQLQRKKKVDPEKDTSLAKIRTDPNAASQQQDSQVLSFDSEDNILKGTIRVEGWNISEAEVSIRSPRWNKNAQYKASISSSHPLRLYQMYNFFNFLRLGHDAILKLEKLLSVTINQNPTAAQQNSNNNTKTTQHATNTSTNDIAYIKKIIEEVSNYLKSANEEFVFQRRNLFPDSPISFTSTIFQPQVPQDLVIEFSISNQELIMTTYCLHVFTAKPSKITKHTNPPQVGQVCQYNHEGTQVWVEIVDKTQVNLQINKINTAFVLTNSCYKLASELYDKLSLFA